MLFLSFRASASTKQSTTVRDTNVLLYCTVFSNNTVRLFFRASRSSSAAVQQLPMLSWKKKPTIRRSWIGLISTAELWKPDSFLPRLNCLRYRSATTHSEKPNRRNFRVWNRLGHARWSCDHGPWLFQTRYFRRFSSAAIPYVVRSTIGLVSDSYASCHALSCVVWTFKKSFIVDKAECGICTMSC